MRSKHFGLFCIQGTGHILPMAALGRALLARGHRVSCFQDARARAMLKAAGLDWQPLGGSAPGVKALETGATIAPAVPGTPYLMSRHAETVLRDGCVAVERAGVDALVVDQGDLAAGSVAERLGLPFVTVSFFPPIFLDSEVPPNIVSWRAGHGAFARMRNWTANHVLVHVLAPIVKTVNDQRRTWGLRAFGGLNDFFSKRALISQLPECLDFPRRPKPPHLHYAGPFQDGRGRYAVEFPWNSLTGAPLVYASMGTVRNTSSAVFRQIATACEGLPLQLVISLGGGLDPDALDELPGQPIVVHYAPQLELLPRATVTITHGGLNTALESLAHGVPLVVLPVTDDQPGVGARITWAGAGRMIRSWALTAHRLRRVLRDVMTEPRYRAAAARIQGELLPLDGPRRAATLIEAACEAPV
jgi:zeaxanthin glucosyltransferase